MFSHHSLLHDAAEAAQTTACVQMVNRSVPFGVVILSHSHDQAHSATSVR